MLFNKANSGCDGFIGMVVSINKIELYSVYEASVRYFVYEPGTQGSIYQLADEPDIEIIDPAQKFTDTLCVNFVHPDPFFTVVCPD